MKIRLSTALVLMICMLLPGTGFSKEKTSTGKTATATTSTTKNAGTAKKTATKTTTAKKTTVKTGTVVGLVGVKDVGPMMNGTAFFFNAASGPPPSATRYWRVPTYDVRVDENARFTAVLPAGKYFMGAIERSSGNESLGPPQEGDNFFIYQNRKGKPRVITVKRGKVVDMGFLEKAVPFSRETLTAHGTTALEGTIRNEAGDPVEGMLVFVFSTPTMAGKPLFVSDRSDKDGRYLLRVHRGGTYYVRARLNYGGPPATDELMGVYKKGKPVLVKTSTIKKNIDLTVSTKGVAPPPR